MSILLRVRRMRLDPRLAGSLDQDLQVVPQRATVRGSHVDTANPVWDEELIETVGNNRLDFIQIIINSNNIPTISYTKPGAEVTTASRNAPLDADCPVSVVSVVSRKTHGALSPAGDLTLSSSGPVTIEPRVLVPWQPPLPGYTGPGTA